MPTNNVTTYPNNFEIIANDGGGKTKLSSDVVLGLNYSSNEVNVKAKFISDLVPKDDKQYDLGTDNSRWRTAHIGQLIQWGQGPTYLNSFTNIENVGNPSHPYAGDAWLWDGRYDTAANRQKASVYVAGGVGIEKDLNVGGHIYGRIEFANTTTYILFTATNVERELNLSFIDKDSFGGSSQESLVYIDEVGEVDGLTYNPSLGRITTDKIRVVSNENATDSDTGALQVKGGVGIKKDIYVDEKITAKNVQPRDDNTGHIGDTSTQWAEAYVHDIYTRIIASTTGTIELKPYAGVTDIYGDIRVRGANPIGTAPVVTNTLYVTVDGDDTNDGRAMDSSRACRTIGGALASPYYQSGTQILVSAGYYLEDNPLRLKPYTSIRGSDIRTTFIEPINKTQDLFHVDSGCYLNYMTFLNGRSGLLEGPFDPGFNRGAYATAFPPLTGDDKIDLFHSPYIQNCTNQSGPWLKDGTMFIPNQTVQIPRAVGIGTWPANTTTIIVTPSSGNIIKQGDTINTGQQNKGFFNARTLLLANKPFLQEQVVGYINNQIVSNIGVNGSIWWDTATTSSFTYNQEFCFRDVGILVENVAYDATFGGNEKAVESGLAYFNGVVSKIAGQELQTTAAINYLNDMVEKVIVNQPVSDVVGSSKKFNQVINYALLDGNISTSSVRSLFGIITNIINNGPNVAPAVYKSAGPDAAFVSAEILMQANRQFIQENTINYVNRFLSHKTFPYNEIKCRRDTGLIVDSIANDLLYFTPEYSQSTFSGLQYWSRDGYTGIIDTEITTTTNSIKYLKDLSVKIIQNITPTDDLIDRFFTPTVSIYQNTSTQGGTVNEVIVINRLFNTLTDILSGNNTKWTDTIIPNGIPSNSSGVQNAVSKLQENKNYLAEEVNAYITASTSAGGLGFYAYNTATCKRDVGYIIDSVCFDLLHGGNRQVVQSAVYYFGFSDTNSNIRTEIVQTTNAFSHLSLIAGQVIQNLGVNALQSKVKQKFSLDSATSAEATILNTGTFIINNIINNGPGVANEAKPISLIASTNPNVVIAYNNITNNRDFLIAETIAYINRTYNPGAFEYDQDQCYRDTGLIVDAVSQDILLGGNFKSVEAGLAYWSLGYNQVGGQETTTTMAINYARDLALQIIANTTATVQTGTVSTQVINPFFKYGGDYMPQEAVTRNFNIITNIIERGPLYAPALYAGGGLFALTGLNGSDVKLPPTVASVDDLMDGSFLIGLSQPTVGFGNNATLYFGDVSTLPKQDKQVDAYVSTSVELGGLGLLPTTWDSRKLDPIGAMGGSLVDGGVISARSPIQSFVYDAFTQLNQGGVGVHVTNDGYAQLVSVFTIFCSIGVQTDNGGIASIVNSNANFGDICLLSKGHGKRAFSGTIYNPPYKAYPDDPDFNPYYPNGFWPNGGQVRVFVPDVDDRPHISLIMEIIPPDGHTNEQSFAGFLNASPTTSTLNTGSITISGIVTDGIAVGNTVYARDQYGLQHNGNGVLYIATGTVVTDVGYQSITLSNALTSGGTDPTNNYALGYVNNNYFDLYFCGNSYYTVLSSEVGEDPKPLGSNILTAGLTVDGTDQIAAHTAVLQHLNTITNQIISNQTVTRLQPTPTGFIYNKTKCSRDVGLLVDAVAQDLLFNGTTQVDFSGIQYWNHGGRVGTINQELTTTTNAINHVRDIAMKIVTGDTSGTRYAGTQPVTTNPATLTEAGIVNTDFSLITDILTNGVTSITDRVVPNRLTASVDTNIQKAYALLQANKSYLQNEAIAYITAVYPTFSYDSGRCATDIGYIIDSVSFDLLYGGNRQAIQSGAYYWGYNDTSTALPGEITQSVAAYNYLKSLLTDIITSTQITAPYQTSQIQALSGSVGTGSEVSTAESLVDRITNIIDGTTPISSVTKAPIDLTRSTDTNIINAATLLEANRSFLQAEITAFVDTNYPPTASVQKKLPLVQGGGGAASFINLRFGEIISILNAPTLAAAELVVKPAQRTKSGPTVTGAGSAITLIKENLTFMADEVSAFVKQQFTGLRYDDAKCRRDVGLIMTRIIYDIESGGRYNSVFNGLSYWSRHGTHRIVQLGENVTRTDLFPDGSNVNFYQRSYISASGYVFEYVGAGTNYGALPQRGIADPVQSKEVVQLDNGKVFFTSTDQNGDFRIGPGLVISQATGVLSGRTFTKSLFANMTPFILAIEGGAL